VTVTDPEAMRYFMTISEAASLVLEAGSLQDTNAVFMLDMGEQVYIKSLAEQMIRLRGMEPGTDIEIVYTGLKPGEKLREDLALEWEVSESTRHPKVYRLSETGHTPVHLEEHIEALAQLANAGEQVQLRSYVFDLLAEERKTEARQHLEPQASSRRRSAVDLPAEPTFEWLADMGNAQTSQDMAGD
jgi:FlaA1/EpsC-like NDP-sugar epimerase